MKKGILSVIVATMGIYFVYWFNRGICETIILSSDTTNVSEFSLHTFGNVYKIMTVSIGLLGLYLGVISMKNKKKIAITGITLSIIVIIISFLPLCEYYLRFKTPVNP
ncbi:hypothetical protein [Aquimarina algiphila]|uniref:DUF4064 domain-containing protein n=1 Tax=Aquimarina algiphila TaxID=2047982 RepID=A0A554VIW6_9FLAO|nr:hypothetical protein [Aquimarina algiphila]TSE07748.1 hypothetical protein FOF46_15070 [Aquimarina algiphila]